MSSGSITRTVRPLTEAERTRLVRTAGAFERQAARARRVALRVGSVTVAVLWGGVTRVASDAPWLVITAFSVVVGSGIVWWAHRGLAAEGGEMGRVVIALRSALERSEAEEVRIRATALVGMEEVEDEGACWGFQVGDRRMVFLCGQEFHATASFPALDVTLIHPLGPAGGNVDRDARPQSRAGPQDSPGSEVGAPRARAPRDGVSCAGDPRGRPGAGARLRDGGGAGSTTVRGFLAPDVS